MCIRDRSGWSRSVAAVFAGQKAAGQWEIGQNADMMGGAKPVSYTHLRAHETVLDLVCRLLLEKKKNTRNKPA